MSADQHLAAPPLLDAMDDGSKLRNDPRVERLLRLFEKKESVFFEQRPEESDQPKRTVGELIFSLPAGVRAPVRVQSLEMRPAGVLVAHESKLLQLWNGDL